MNFDLHAEFTPTGDQPNAIKELISGLNTGEKHQTLLGVTGSGKTFTIANVIKELNRPTLVLSHNKTLAAQLFSEFKQFFPNNAIEYFVSYYDYYQPEAYIPSSGTYIEKDLSINEEIEKFRLNTTSSLLSGRKDIIVIASVSCIYGIGNPDDFHKGIINLKIGDIISRDDLLQKLVHALYCRTTEELLPGNFRVKGDTVDISLAYNNSAYRIHFLGNEIEEIETFNPKNGNIINSISNIRIAPASIFLASKNKINIAIDQIQEDLKEEVDSFEKVGLKLEAKRLLERTNLDIEMIKEIGYCSGIENYSRYFDGREKGTRPFCLLDYFSKDFITIIDESHVTIPQIKAMYGGDRSRKETLVEHGFRLNAALDNRPLKFSEFENLCNQIIYLSATPSTFEIEKCQGIITEQVIRPTGLLDPKIEVRSSKHQIDDLQNEIQKRITNSERVLVTTLTKRMAEEFSKYLVRSGVKARYIHSDVDTLERVEIIHKLKNGELDVLIGVNLLREGLDLPEVSLVAIIDADKEGFLRSETALTQTIGRTARNINGFVIMYADKITKSMNNTIKETNRRRRKQELYNKKNNITPTPISSKKNNVFTQQLNPYKISNEDLITDLQQFNTEEKLQKEIASTKRKMQKMAKELNFLKAGVLRDKIIVLEKKLNAIKKRTK